MPPIPDSCHPATVAVVLPSAPSVRSGHYYFAGQLPPGTRFQVHAPGEVRTGSIHNVSPGSVYAHMDHEGKVVPISHATPVIVLEKGGPVKEPTPLPKVTSLGIKPTKVEEDIVESLQEFSNELKGGRTAEELAARSRQPSTVVAPDSGKEVEAVVYFSQETKGSEVTEDAQEDDDTSDSDGPPPRHLVEVKWVGRKGNPNRYRQRRNKQKHWTDPSGTGLTKTQADILKALYRANRAMDRKEIAIEADTDYYSLPRAVGVIDDDARAINDSKYGESLLTRGYIRQAPVAAANGREQVGYVLTKEGKGMVQRHFLE